MALQYTFLSFPGEIRNQIYRLLLTLPPPSASPENPTKNALTPSILRANQQIYHEAALILYASNTFIAHPNLLTSLPRLRLHYPTIPYPRPLSLIKRYHVRVRLDCDPNFDAERARQAFSGVEELSVEVFQAQFGSCDFAVLRLLEGVRGVGRARVYGSVVGFGGYVDWLERVMMLAEGEVVDSYEEGKDESDRRIIKVGNEYDIWVVSCWSQGWSTS